MSEFERVRAAARAGDQKAIEQWYREYGPALRLVAKRKLKELHLPSILEPDDILDSAFGMLCVDPSRLDDMDPWQVYAYLEQMINRTAITAHRRRAAQKRGNGTTATTLDLESVSGRDAEAADEAALNEELHLAYARMTGVERKICMYRVDQYSWEKIGEFMDMSAAAAQKRYERAVTRVSRELQCQ